MRRYFYIAVGFISFGLGAAGAALPLLPTTPFLLLSAYCFSRSSKRFHEWLIQTKLYDFYVSDWIETRSIPRKKKYSILLSIYVLMGISIYFIPFMIGKILLSMMVIAQTYIILFVVPDRH
ncbi:YbaN family protein [Dolosicoccus paucivorans]|uniref:DUF454 domain-containing protein n=1 Tax=Dolosicoccus paucivorans TaxID=84521 RepID=A0A1G8P3N1_9LACT|nr:YbaN family protein [Dolosicoccus paucivorans]PMB84429.1 DUF454 domain-containing protein [Dolosicoccus paucivorans]PMC59042.1 DUF454 domain-containing protein [Dolosicoccus paucivorans]SDI87094.1 hypothetical protein SAMN04487994_10633 [Dolosicoccus paucivorans]